MLTPVASFIEPACEEGLRELEKRGYAVRRVRGYSAIDVGRCQLASDALADGFADPLRIRGAFSRCYSFRISKLPISGSKIPFVATDDLPHRREVRA